MVKRNNAASGAAPKPAAERSAGTARTSAERPASASASGVMSVRWAGVCVGLAFVCGIVASWMAVNPSAAFDAPAPVPVSAHSGAHTSGAVPKSKGPKRSEVQPDSGVYHAASGESDADSIGLYLSDAMRAGGVLSRSDLETERAPVKARGGRMIMAWQTPIYRVNIASFGKQNPKKPFNLAAFNGAIADRVLYYYRTVIEQYQTKQRAGDAAGVVFDASDATNANQIFYEWQHSGGSNLLFNHSESRQMFAVGQMAADIMLQTIGQSPEAIAERPQSLGAWATVHHKSLSHTPHTHPDNLLSCVYYVRMPPDAGKLVLMDPRGPLPPFDTRIKIVPQEGDLIIFPSWLTHYVTPTAGSEERISIAFNLAVV